MKTSLFIALILISLTGMGLASREGRLHAGQPHGLDPYDAHLRYYENVRPVLLGALLGNRLLCNGGEAMER